MSSTTDDTLVQIQKLRWAIVEAHPPGLPSRRGTASVTHRSGRSPSRPLSQDLPLRPSTTSCPSGLSGQRNPRRRGVDETA
jgi:hypothetical protein